MAWAIRTLMCLGSVFLIVSVAFVALTAGESWLLWRLRRVRAMDCQSILLDLDPPGTAAVWGYTTASLDGPLRAPVSGQDCLWYRTAVYHVTTVDETTTYQLLWKTVRGEPVGLSDGSGTVLVDSRLFERRVCSLDTGDPVVTRPIDEAIVHDRRRGLEPDSALAKLIGLGLIAPDLLPRKKQFVIGVQEDVICPGKAVLAVGWPSRDQSGSVVLRSVRWRLGLRGFADRPLPDLLNLLDGSTKDGRSMIWQTLVLASILLGLAYLGRGWLLS